jgi:hypothetical protein
MGKDLSYSTTYAHAGDSAADPGGVAVSGDVAVIGADDAPDARRAYEFAPLG